MSISKRSDGRYVVKFKDIKGSWRQRTFASKIKAKRFDAECRYEGVENRRLTVLEAVLMFLRSTEHCKGVVEQYKFVVFGNSKREGPAQFLCDRFVDTLTRMDMERVRENCRAAGNCNTTINMAVSRLKAAFSWCVDNDIVSENPWGKYRNLPNSSIKHRTGTLEEFRLVYPLLPPWLQWACHTSLALCLRPGIKELFSLEWNAFNFKKNTVSVYMPKVKTDKIVYPPATYMKEAYARFVKDTANGQTVVCRNKHDKPLKITEDYGYHWEKACKQVGVTMPMYALRHIVASEMLASGVDLAAVSAQLGHKNIQTTSTYYTHALTRSQLQAARALETCTNLVQDGAAF